MDLETVDERKTKRVPQRNRAKRRTRTSPELLDEIVWEILTRLPVKSLARFKSVSKAWHAIISDPVFVCAHLQCSKQKPSVLINPQVYLAGNAALSTDIRFYQCSALEQPQYMMRRRKSSSATATLLYGRRFPDGEFWIMSRIAHCDGLVLITTDTKIYIFNPATRDTIALPESQRNIHDIFLPVGFGLDVSTGRYKVARSFYRSRDSDPTAMGMEVFTINGQDDGSWRETLVDPPYPIWAPQTGVYCKGCLFYYIENKNLRRPPWGLLRFSLQDETFGVTFLSQIYPIVEYKDLLVHEFDGQLCATFFCKPLQKVVVYRTRDILDPEWNLIYIINFHENCYPMASLGDDGILLRGVNGLFRYYFKAHGIKEDDIFMMGDLRYLGPSEDTLGHALGDLCWFDIISYTESLVPITPKVSLQAL